MGGRNKSGRDVVGDRLIASMDGEPWRSRLFRRFLETAAEGTPQRAFAVAVASDVLLRAIGGRSRTVRLSGATAAKQRRAHPDLRPDDYALVQRIVDEGEIFKARRRRHAIGFATVDGRLWRAVLKATADGSETYLVSLHKASKRNLRSAGQRLERIADGGGCPALR